ncbi:MAG TPA: SDR family oxidoreductase [Bacteroidales bacterium]
MDNSKIVDKQKTKILITGGAGFIGSNLVEYFLKNEKQVVCLDNLATGFKKNIEPFLSNPDFIFIEGDIRNLETCKKSVKGVDYVLHQAALGSVPRSIVDPINTNSVNIDGFLNMLVASRDEKVKRFVYAASSSTYGDSVELPKVEDKIGNPLSPYAITKYVNELYADVFARTYGMEAIGLRYFNVFGKNQDPNGAYAAVIPLWVKKMMEHKSPVINGDENYSRDFTYIENVIQANEKAMLAPAEVLKTKEKKYVHQVFNVAFGSNTKLIELFAALRDNLAKHDPAIQKIQPIIGPYRDGDIPHSQASIEKAKKLINYQPKFNAQQGFELVSEWYYNNLK